MTKDKALQQARQLLWRYRHETPIGHQPYMICHQADEAFERIDEALAQPAQPVQEQPAQRTWIWLSDADIKETIDSICQYNGDYDEWLCKKIETKIKELNT